MPSTCKSREAHGDSLCTTFVTFQRSCSLAIRLKIARQNLHAVNPILFQPADRVYRYSQLQQQAMV
jgi:hypothetical protein